MSKVTDDLGWLCADDGVLQVSVNGTAPITIANAVAYRIYKLARKELELPPDKLAEQAQLVLDLYSQIHDLKHEINELKQEPLGESP